MKKPFRTAILISFICLFFIFSLQAQLKTVKTQNGLVEGYQKDGVNIFKGIPFAAPPVGDLRWRAPLPAKNWSVVRKCELFSASPMQARPVPFAMWTEEFISPPEPLSEDCLYLNVWTAAKSDREKLPVFIWIYGGGFVSGSAACAIYDGEEMAKKGVIYVSINYRIGPFGFLAHPELSKESGKNASGNYAFLDQIAALQWIQKNIAAFGGDPGNITIAGQSAGSFSVNALVASPLAKGLFHRAIAQSGGLIAGNRAKKLGEAEKVGQTFVQNAKANSIDELRLITAEEIQKIAETVPFGSFAPVLEDYVLPSEPLSWFGKGNHNDVPLLTGWVTGDGSLLMSQALSAEKFMQNSKEKYGSKVDEFLKIFPANSDDEAKASQSKLSLCEFAALQSYLWATNNKSKSWLYQFSFVPTDKPGFPNYGAFHTSEVPFALHALKRWNRPWQARDYELEKIMSDYWVNFAKTGNPNGRGLPEWKSYDKQAGNIIELGEKVVLRPALLKNEFDFLGTTLGPN